MGKFYGSPFCLENSKDSWCFCKWLFKRNFQSSVLARNLSNEERELVNAVGIPADRLVHMSGTDDRLIELYSSAAVFVYPSLYEGFGIPPLEAMTLGCPVACSNSSSIPEVVGDAAELFDPTDEEMMCGAIERVVADTERSRKLVDEVFYRNRRLRWN